MPATIHFTGGSPLTVKENPPEVIKALGRKAPPKLTNAKGEAVFVIPAQVTYVEEEKAKAARSARKPRTGSRNKAAMRAKY